MKKIAVLGSNGFLGSLISKGLTECDVTPVHRGNCDLIDSDQVHKFLLKNQFDIIINCASAAGGKTDLGTFNLDDFRHNLQVHTNLKYNSASYGLLINIGSGAEYDIRNNISNVDEYHSRLTVPADSYGLSKNIISSMCEDQPNAVTLRIFGCFDPSEPSFRLLRTFCDNYQNGPMILKNDRRFSWISAIDLIGIIEQIIERPTHLPKNINCAYEEQLLLSEFLQKYCDIHYIAPNFKIESTTEKDYTCLNLRMQRSFHLKHGLDKSLDGYK